MRSAQHIKHPRRNSVNAHDVFRTKFNQLLDFSQMVSNPLKCPMGLYDLPVNTFELYFYLSFRCLIHLRIFDKRRPKLGGAREFFACVA
ncbi:hypothetical protein YQ44_14365 [Janthinobacterium sp. 1_2014MBL_MicDiv]|nr:hypothetical protein YQ44_14365 [Janthinobacterium sp. 1_2014MBL_MicDiv]